MSAAFAPYPSFCYTLIRYEYSINLNAKRDFVHHLLGVLFYRDEFMRKAFRGFAVYPKSVF